MVIKIKLNINPRKPFKNFNYSFKSEYTHIKNQ